ncbi:uncharacterized protein LOC110246524 isoform X1 [Exaiptasia diaphana]|uniref:Uncharacterized protein n=1 Tax=Exaiptasia diaphana TaxID=2652724 RepID=A0A913XQC0_EXADI|nr:uncharacterized protein LOC110246524 isoform X1 [Exaiptasia diaphana]XP_020908534.1 uncharacterized protein LOC110246524 isoform X1 [Exaiptasia diaphana]
MATTITIHHGEILLIQRMIQNTKDARKLRGALYGLYTQSGQPVVQLICGSKEKKNLSKCQKYLESEHGLLLLGRWTIAASDADVSSKDVGINLVFDFKGELYTAFDAYCNGANLEILQGNGALRLYEPLTQELGKLLKTDNSPIFPDIRVIPNNVKKSTEKDSENVIDCETASTNSFLNKQSNYTRTNTDNNERIVTSKKQHERSRSKQKETYV